MAIPKARFAWPLTIDSSNNKVNFRINGEVSDRTATVASGTYTTPELWLTAVVTAMTAAGGGLTWTYAIGVSGRVTLAPDDLVTQTNIKFSTGANAATSVRDIIGATHTDTGNAVSHTFTYQHQNAWYALVAIRSDSQPVFEEPNSVVTLAMSGAGKEIAEAVLTLRDVKWDFIDAAHTFIAKEATPDINTALERWWRVGRGKFIYWPDWIGAYSTSDTYFVDGEVLANGFKPRRMFDGKELYSLGPYKIRKFV